VPEVYGWFVIALIFATSVFALGRIWERRKGAVDDALKRGEVKGYKSGLREGFALGGVAVYRGNWMHRPNSRWTPVHHQPFPVPERVEEATAEIPAVKAYVRPVGLAMVHPRPPQAPRHAAPQ
jgi:hypothetical protein